jgi:hypothetical protein
MPKQFDANVLNQLANTEEIEIETRSVTIPGRTRRTIIWVIVDNNQVYIRSLRGRNGRWYQEITATPEGVIHVDGQHLAVHAVPVTDEVTIMRVSNEVLRKYHDSPSVNSMVRIETLSTTLLLEPA